MSVQMQRAEGEARLTQVETEYLRLWLVLGPIPEDQRDNSQLELLEKQIAFTQSFLDSLPKE